MNVSFAGCGFLGIYHLGVAHALVSNGKRLLPNVQRFSGASAGALVAAVLTVVGDDMKSLEACKEFCLDLARKTKLLWLGVMTPGTDLLGPLEVFLNTLMPPNAHEIANNRLFVSVTNCETKKNELVSKFSSRQELIGYLLASSCVPHITGIKKSVTVNGTKYNDGGLTNNLPTFEDGRTIRVSPFDGRQDICPLDHKSNEWFMNINKQDFRLNLRNLARGMHTLLPPSEETMLSYYRAGMFDAIRFLHSEGLYDSVDGPMKSNLSASKEKTSATGDSVRKNNR